MDRQTARPVVILTGATSGIGRAAAIAFARRGYRIGLLARGGDGLRATLADVQGSGGEGLVLQADVSNEKEVEAAAAAAVERWGAIDVWVNNAMVTVFSDVSHLEAGELRRVTEVTYHGAVWGTMAALRHMKPRGRGVIVQVGSALAYRSIPLQAAYRRMIASGVPGHLRVAWAEYEGGHARTRDYARYGWGSAVLIILLAFSMATVRRQTRSGFE